MRLTELACDSCFQKCLICDSKQPVCTHCENSGSSCTVTWDRSYFHSELPSDRICKARITWNHLTEHSGGEFGTTYVLRSPTHGGDMLLKFPRVRHTDMRSRFAQLCSREYATWSRLSHPNIVPFECVAPAFIEEELIILPYMQNGNVMEYLSVNPEVDRIQLMADITSAVCYLHEQDRPLVHGRITPYNVLISPSGDPLLSDFGLSYPVEERRDGSETLLPDDYLWYPKERLLGTYPTEFVRTTEAEIFTLCRTFYCVLTGRRPYRGIPAWTIVGYVLNPNGPRPERPSASSVPWLTDDMWALLLWGWSDEPGERPTARKLLEYFKKWKHHETDEPATQLGRLQAVFALSRAYLTSGSSGL